MRLSLLAAALLVSAGLSAHADSVTLTLTQANGYIPASGGSLAFEATVVASAANNAAVFLNGDSFNVTAPVTLDDTDFFSNYPLSVAPGTSFTGDLFVLSLPANSPVDTYLGSFTLLGGSNGSSYDPLSTVNFSVTDVPRTSATPEPSSFALLGTGMLAAAGIARKRFARLAA